ncbi:MAG TPA: filament integrity protein FraC [Trichocoleus sp.]|jgi:hypothetical protein
MFPLRAIALQILFLLLSIAIEAVILHRKLKVSPQQSVQFATSINLLSTVLGWLVLFSVLTIPFGLPPSWSLNLDVALLNFVLFNQLSSSTASTLIFLGFITFFASFLVKQLGLLFLKWLLQPTLNFRPLSQPNPVKYVMRDPRTKIQGDALPQAAAILEANAWSYSAIVLVLVVRFVIENATG